MKKSMPDVICAAVLLIFLTTVAVQVPAIPKVSRAYPIFLLAVAYLMGIWLLVKSLRRLKHEEKHGNRSNCSDENHPSLLCDDCTVLIFNEQNRICSFYSCVYDGFPAVSEV